MSLYFVILSVNFHFYYQFPKFMYIEDLIAWYFWVFIIALVFNIIINATVLGGISCIINWNWWGVALIATGLSFLGLESKYHIELFHSTMGNISWLWNISCILINCAGMPLYMRSHYLGYFRLSQVSLKNFFIL